LSKKKVAELQEQKEAALKTSYENQVIDI
jgi:hypothetical protein